MSVPRGRAVASERKGFNAPDSDKLDELLAKEIGLLLKHGEWEPGFLEHMTRAITELTLKQVLMLIDQMGDTAMPRIGKSGKYVRSPQSFQDGYAEARAELRQSAERIWKI